MRSCSIEALFNLLDWSYVSFCTYPGPSLSPGPDKIYAINYPAFCDCVVLSPCVLTAGLWPSPVARTPPPHSRTGVLEPKFPVAVLHAVCPCIMSVCSGRNTEQSLATTGLVRKLSGHGRMYAHTSYSLQVHSPRPPRGAIESSGMLYAWPLYVVRM